MDKCALIGTFKIKPPTHFIDINVRSLSGSHVFLQLEKFIVRGLFPIVFNLSNYIYEKT